MPAEVRSARGAEVTHENAEVRIPEDLRVIARHLFIVHEPPPVASAATDDQRNATLQLDQCPRTLTLRHPDRDRLLPRHAQLKRRRAG